ncbi:9355_t:CDS:1, partial [Funneliformis mosseae]
MDFGHRVMSLILPGIYTETWLDSDLDTTANSGQIPEFFFIG